MLKYKVKLFPLPKLSTRREEVYSPALTESFILCAFFSITLFETKTHCLGEKNISLTPLQSVQVLDAYKGHWINFFLKHGTVM